MAKQKAESEGLLFLLGFGADTDDLFNTYIKEIVNEKLREYQSIIQWGAKEGQSLYLHILNGICVLERLRPILKLDDIEVQVLFSAFSIHDLNKLNQFQNEKRSFNYLANAKKVGAALTHLEIGRFFPEWQDYLKDIEVLVRAHSGYYNTYDETLDLNYDPYSLEKDRLLKYLVPIIQAMDVIDLSKTLEERDKKQSFLDKINKICGVKYKFVYHKVSEQRGILTNVIHNEIVNHLESGKNLLPLLYYPNGVHILLIKILMYISQTTRSEQLETLLFITLRQRLAENSVSLLEVDQPVYKSTKNALDSGYLSQKFGMKSGISSVSASM